MMAEVSQVTTDTPVTTENIEPKDGHVEKVQPHYLSASSGSCHDVCKNGIKNVSDTKGSKPFLKRGSTTPYTRQDLLRSVIDPVQRRHKSVIISMDSLDINKETPINCEVRKKEIQETSKKVFVNLRQQISSPAELKYVSVKHLNSLKPKTSSPSATLHLSRRQSEIVIPKDLGTLKMGSPGSNKRNSQINTTEELGNSQINTTEELGASVKHSVDIKPKPSQTKASLVSGLRQFSGRHSETIIKPKGLGIRRMNSLEGSSSKRDNDIKISEEMSDCAKHATDLKQKPLQTKESSSSTQWKLNRRYSDIIIPKDLEPLLLSPVGGSSGRRNIEKKEVNKETGTPKVFKKKSLVPKRVSSSPLSTGSEFIKNAKKVPSASKIKRSVKQVESDHPNNEKVLEKMLYIIEPQAENQAGGLPEIGGITTHFSSSLSPISDEKGTRNGESGVKANQSPPTESAFYLNTHSSLPSSSSTSQSPTSFSSDVMHGEDGALESCESETENQIADLELEPKRTRRIGEVGSEDRDWSPKHLIFKSGKTVNVQPENTSPRRLKFRQGKVLAENQNGKFDIKGRNLRRLVSDNALHETKTEPVKVVLKHQDVEEKKDNQRLFNSVIEDTASKLVQTRKSKVKALVGAFETLISLRDSKSSEITSA